MRRAFTLLELIVTIIIIAVLVALLLPAVSRVRHAAVMMSCKNNLKHLGVSMHGYRDAHKHFPPGTMPHPTLPPDERLSWQVSVVPHMESMEPLFKKFDTKAAWDSPTNLETLKSAPMPVFRCPAFMGPQPEHWPAGYIGIAGIGSDAATLPLDGPGVGFFGYDRQLKPEQVKDGLSQTLALIETAHDLGPYTRGGYSTVRGLDLSDEPLLGEGRPFGGLHKSDRTFGGTRPLGTQMLLADGSVRLSQVHVDPFVLGALATIAGGEDVPTNW
jgi:prepilin-type N-terminal cleavage/methylation domain-containing protein